MVSGHVLERLAVACFGWDGSHYLISILVEKPLPPHDTTTQSQMQSLLRIHLLFMIRPLVAAVELYVHVARSKAYRFRTLAAAGGEAQVCLGAAEMK